MSEIEQEAMARGEASVKGPVCKADHILHVAMFGMNVGVIHDREMFTEECAKVGVDEPHFVADACAVWLHNKTSNHFIVWLRVNAKPKLVYHEFLHTAFHILEACGVPTDHDNQEALAHLQGHLVDLYASSRKDQRRQGGHKRGN